MRSMLDLAFLTVVEYSKQSEATLANNSITAITLALAAIAFITSQACRNITDRQNGYLEFSSRLSQSKGYLVLPSPQD